MRRNNFFNSVWLNWTLFEGMKRFYDIDNARSGKKELEERKIFVRETLKHQLTRLAQQSYLLDIQEKLLSKSRERILINLDKAKSLLREGQISSSDTLEFWQKILEVDKETGRIAETKKTIYREIGFLTGKDQMLRPEAGDLPPMADSGLYVPTARADMLALKAKGKGIEHQYSGLGSLYWPKVSIGAAWQYDKPGYDPISNNWVSYTKYNIGLQWIIWDWNKRKIAREKLQILAVNNTLEEKRLMDERKKELDKLRYKKSRLEEELTITQRQLELKNKYYRYRKEQYEMQQIDASQLSLTENELTSLELKIAAVKKEIETNKIDQIYVCGNFSRWIAEKE
jgi:outer membrane protein TolC